MAAFSNLAQSGVTVAAIAALFGVTERLVGQRLPSATPRPRFSTPTARMTSNQGVDITPGKHRGTDATALLKKGKPTTWNNHALSWVDAAAAAANALPEPLQEDAKDAIETLMLGLVPPHPRT